MHGIKRAVILAGAFALSAFSAERVIVFHDDGGWCWYQDERVIVDRGRLIIGAVASGLSDPLRRGAIEATVYDLKTGAKSTATLHRAATPEEHRRWFDDHNVPAFVVRPDGRILAMYSQHGREEKIYYRISAQPHDATGWGEERVFVPSPTSRITYTNLHWLAGENGGKGRLYNFFRGMNNSNKPSYTWSDDSGETWKAGGVFIDVPARFRHRPYGKYASNGKDTVHIAYTDGHPRDFDNSIYHVFYREGKLHRSDGTVIRGLKEGLRTPEEGTRVYQGDPNNVAWISDLHIGADGNPYLAFSVQKDSAGLAPKSGGADHRYRYARWDGRQWICQEIAHAGSRLYPGEDDYTGNIALDPHDPNTVYISTNADPVTGKPLVSEADGERHWEIFRGNRGGSQWRWRPVTRDSTDDNIRPVVPAWAGKRYAVLWLRGKMRAYTDYAFQIVGLTGTRP
jgi:BNR repeat-containing family member